MILTTILILPCIENDNTQNIQYIKNFQINCLGIFLSIQKTLRISWFHRPVIPSLNAYGVSCRIRVRELPYLIHSRFTQVHYAQIWVPRSLIKQKRLSR